MTKLLEINFADISLVHIKNKTPHCKHHGAMNKMNTHGYWRCITVVSGGEFTGDKLNDNVCRAGCQLKKKSLFDLFKNDRKDIFQSTPS